MCFERSLIDGLLARFIVPALSTLRVTGLTDGAPAMSESNRASQTASFEA